jgi:hypothetical protein
MVNEKLDKSSLDFISGLFAAIEMPTGTMYFVFCRLYPSPPATTAVFKFYLSSLYSYLTLYRRCGLPNHMMGEVSWEPKKKTNVGLLIFNPR